jgi:hypothetical protein
MVKVDSKRDKKNRYLENLRELIKSLKLVSPNNMKFQLQFKR